MMGSKRRIKILKIVLMVSFGIIVLVLNLMFLKNIGNVGPLPSCH